MDIPTTDRRDRRRKKKTTSRIKHAVAVVASLGLLSGAGLFAFQNLTSHNTADTSAYIKAEDRPKKLNTVNYTTPIDGFSGPLNILLIGSDSRGSSDTSVVGMRSDTTILAHISADRKRVDMVSIPRDSLVDIPACTLPGGEVTYPETAKFNAAFSQGGQTGDVGAAAACSIKTFENLSGVYVDGFAVIDFQGFEKVVDSIGGVNFTVDQEIRDPSFENLVIHKGTQTFNGKTALQYARVRKADGMDGSDLSRIDRQQELLSAIVEKAKSKLTDLPAMYSLVGSAAKMTTTSPELGDSKKLAGLAWALKDAQKSNINFMTVPVVDAGDGANVYWSEESTALWENVKADLPLKEKTAEPVVETPSSEALPQNVY